MFPCLRGGLCLWVLGFLDGRHDNAALVHLPGQLVQLRQVASNQLAPALLVLVQQLPLLGVYKFVRLWLPDLYSANKKYVALQVAGYTPFLILM